MGGRHQWQGCIEVTVISRKHSWMMIQSHFIGHDDCFVNNSEFGSAVACLMARLWRFHGRLSRQRGSIAKQTSCLTTQVTIPSKLSRTIHIIEPETLNPRTRIPRHPKP